jgi:integrase
MKTPHSGETRRTARVMGKEHDLSDDEVKRILQAAESVSERDFLFLSLIGERGLRIGEVVGVKNTVHYERWRDPERKELGRETAFSTANLPGLLAEDVKNGGLFIRRKGGRAGLEKEKEPVKLQLPSWLYERLAEYAKDRSGKLFDFAERQGYNLVQKYAKAAGLENWAQIHSHRFRHYFITRAHWRYKDLRLTQQLAGHSSWTTTMRYIAAPTSEQERSILDELSPSERKHQKSNAQ